jgi:orotate phosphoribosyltransferase
MHNDNPNLPLSPWYLHYPKEGEPGSELLGDLYTRVGQAFFELCETHATSREPDKLAAVPTGALPLVDAFAQYYSAYPQNVVVFGKRQLANGTTEFTGPTGEWEDGDELVIGEDHTSAGRNKRLIVAAAKRVGFSVNTILTVVDREQGGVQNMADEGVELLPIMTGTNLLEHGVHEGYITQATMDEVVAYTKEQRGQ